MVKNEQLFNPILKNLVTVPNLTVITIPMIVLGTYGLYDIFTNFEYIKLIYLMLGYFYVNVIGVTAGLHRYFSHKSFKVGKWRERLMLSAAVLSGQGSPVWWVALHRGYHHSGSDTLKDPHSPIYGFWHSILLWMFRIKPDAISFRYAVDMLRNKEVVWVSTHYTKLWVLFNLVLVLISFKFWLFFAITASFITLVTYNLTNCLNHIPSLGYTNYETRDNSMNVPWIWPLVLGECWHNNHHGRAGNCHFKQKWWEFDPSGFFINHFFKDK